ncbi:MAG TPA: pyruvate, water dikinase regulatory protein [Prolixibacteraceae bacterium]|nr:pyruvate, water dikinase regulatory protein [Prolixibacteraceae bacterium]
MPDNSKKRNPLSIYIVSGGRCLAAHTMVRSLLVQYPDNKISVRVFPEFSEKNIEEIISKAKKQNTIIAHTLVRPGVRNKLVEECQKNNIKQVDYMGPLANYLDEEGLKSINEPGLFRKINAPYYERIDAMEYTMNHDDGMNPERLKNADIILTGVSRAGKTPLSVYMSMFGWKVANVPLVLGIAPPNELFEVDPERVFGLRISSTYLIPQRAKRMVSFNQEINNYTDKKIVNKEVAFANSVFEKGNFTIINVTNKPIESSANEITGIITDRFGFNKQKINTIDY